MKRSFILFSIVLVAIGCLLVAAASNGWFAWTHQPMADRAPESEELVVPDEPTAQPDRTGQQLVGGVWRPVADVKSSGANRPDRSEKPFLPSTGTIPLVKPDANPHAESVAEALKNPKELGHRLTSMIPAPPFDEAAYASNPKKYLETIEPGRIWQSAKAGPDVTPIRRPEGNKYYQRVLLGESAILRADTTKFAPVTYYSPSLGQFENGLTTITVQADENGLAAAPFKLAPGTRGEIEVFASSPLHSGRLRYLVKVVVPEVAASAAKKPVAN